MVARLECYQVHDHSRELFTMISYYMEWTLSSTQHSKSRKKGLYFDKRTSIPIVYVCTSYLHVYRYNQLASNNTQRTTYYLKTKYGKKANLQILVVIDTLQNHQPSITHLVLLQPLCLHKE